MSVYIFCFQLERNHLICDKSDETVQNITLPKDKYISSLIGPCLECEEVQKHPTLESLSMFQIRKLPQIIERVKHLMRNGNYKQPCSSVNS